MGAFRPLLLLVVVVIVVNAGSLLVPVRGLSQDGLYLLEAKRALTVPVGALADWDPRDATPCSWTGVSCGGGGDAGNGGAVTGVSIPDANLAGPFPAALCRIPRLESVSLYMNHIGPAIAPATIARCKALVHLDLSTNALVGPLPAALADLPELVYLNLGSNNFSGPVPEAFGRFKKLESLSLVSNLLGGELPAFLGGVATLRQLNLSYNLFSSGPVPAELGNLTALQVLSLAGCNLIGSIPSFLGRLGNLTDLDLSTNALAGAIPPEITGLTSAVRIELYSNSLSGPMPKGFGKLPELRSIDIAMNRLDGGIPDDLFDAPKLETVRLYANSLTGPVPESVAKASSLVELRLFANRLNGTLSADLGRNTPLVCLDLSDNSISGEIPRGICDRGELEELLVLDNALTGSIPEGLGRCRRLRRLRLSNNRLDGDLPAAVWGLPHMSLLELNDNQLGGEISPVIAGAANLSKLVVSNNRLTGRIPSEIGSVSKLYELSADGNMLSGPLPSSLGGLAELGRLVLHDNLLSGQLLRGIHSWKKLSELNLASNSFIGDIPPELGDLPVLNHLDLSGNRLTGEVPMQLEYLKLSQLNVSNNQLSGQLPPQYATEAYRSSFLDNPGLCGDIAGLCATSEGGGSKSHSGFVWMMNSMLMSAAAVLVAGAAWFYWRRRSFSTAKLAGDRLKWKFASFHKLSFSEDDILGCLDEDNVVGSGASGKVYRAVLSNGEVVAVKKLWSCPLKKDAAGEHGGELASSADGSFEAEVTTLGKLRHRNIVKLLCCCTRHDRRLLVYEYMPNGSLGDVLRSSKKLQAGLLDWPRRYKVALGAAEALSYLHHGCVPAIVHRDVKSNNILLDADFGVAKVVVEAAARRDPMSMSVVAGSCGYIAPEYAYTLSVTEKSDVYSFGVVLMELVTGKPPPDLVRWVCSTVDREGVDPVVDSSLDMAAFRAEIGRVLDIGIMCTSSPPTSRPAMRTVVEMLREARAQQVIRPPGLEKDGNLSPCSHEDGR